MKKTHRVAAIGLATSMIATFVGTSGSGAFAQDSEAAVRATPAVEANQTIEAEPVVQAPEAADTQAEPVFVSQPVVQEPDAEQIAADEAANAAPPSAASLADLVSEIPADASLSRDMHCLAGAIYFESKGEPLEGQLAVARVIVNRSESSRFPNSYCGVVYQRSQFSFVRGGQMPRIATSSAAWRKAKAIARIAHEELWDSPVPGALFFHATYVSPRWRLTRVGQVKNHIFYR